MFQFTEEQNQVRKTVSSFALKEMAPIAIENDEKERFPVEVFKKMANLGFLGMPFPEKYGGAGMDYISYIITLEEFAKVCASTALSYSAHVSLAAFPINEFGTEEQKKQYLSPLVSGEKLGSFGLTEPSAGSDAGGTKTVAVKDGSNYILNGSKNFITNAVYADIFVVTAVTDKAKGTKGISSFIVEKGMSGFEVGKKEKKLGMRASPTSMLHFENCVVPEENLLGKLNEGFKQFLITLDGGRIGIAAQALGIAKGALQRTMKYVQEREQFSRKLSSFEALQFKLADMAVKIRSAELLIYDAAERKVKGLKNKFESSAAKLFATEMAMDVTKDAIQLHGGYGYIKEYEVERFWRDAKLLEIGEGTSEIQRLVIFRELLKNPNLFL
jgi:alkylation response protein AidB-like acyl-CoA dehydrogenase